MKVLNVSLLIGALAIGTTMGFAAGVALPIWLMRAL